MSDSDKLQDLAGLPGDQTLDLETAADVQSAEDPRVIRCLHDFGLALQAGLRPPRQDVLAMFPEIVEELSACLDGLEFIYHVAPQLAAGSGADNAAQATQFSLAPLGDFRILREIGRGGMGVVYEAEQMSLGRKVAVKVLPFAAVLDSRQLQRFKNEAQAAASLHHSHIVPVYSVGCERGVHYYAMQFVPGQTLAEAIEALKWRPGEGTLADGDSAPNALHSANRQSACPTQPIAGISTSRGIASNEFFRSAARLGVDVAEALDYAHQQGVVHRDIKPLNLILDEHGDAWITDFGLARFDASGSLTITGDLLGTLRYMSPEQAAAERAVVDQRTDVYSLGATLYELLTLEPAFAASSRQELLRRIISDEPRAPRRLNPALPPELETIVLKAMAKQPAARYATAQAFADDLRRYLADQPIAARRPTPLERLRKWSRRHASLAASITLSALAMLLLAVISLAIGYLAVTREQSRTAQALEEAKQGREAAAAEREQADAHLRQALDAIERMLGRVGDEQLRWEPQSEPIRRRLLDDAIEFYEAFSRHATADSVLRRQTARIEHRIGNIHSRLGELEPAERRLRRALAEYEKLTAEHPEQPEGYLGAAEAATDLGAILRYVPGRERDAENAHRRSVEMRRRLAQRFPKGGHEASLAQGCHELAYYLGLSGQPDEGEKLFREALAIQSRLAAQSPDDAGPHRQHASYLNSFGLMLRIAGRPHEAEQAHRQALAILEGLQEVHDVRGQLARTLAHLAYALAETDRRSESESLLLRAAALRKRLYEERPQGIAERAELAMTVAALAGLLARDGRPSEAEPHYLEAIAVQEQLVRESPAVPKHRSDLALMLESQGRSLIDGKRAADAEAALARARKLREELALETPENDECQRNLAYCRLLLALAYSRLGATEQQQTMLNLAADWMVRRPGRDEKLDALRGEIDRSGQRQAR